MVWPRLLELSSWSLTPSPVGSLQSRLIVSHRLSHPPMWYVSLLFISCAMHRDDGWISTCCVEKQACRVECLWHCVLSRKTRLFSRPYWNIDDQHVGLFKGSPQCGVVLYVFAVIISGNISLTRCWSAFISRCVLHYFCYLRLCNEAAVMLQRFCYRVDMPLTMLGQLSPHASWQAGDNNAHLLSLLPFNPSSQSPKSRNVYMYLFLSCVW